MARPIHKLTPLGVNKITKRGWYSDGGGLYLQVGPTGSKSWLFRYMRDGKARSVGLGAIHTVTLSEARQEAHKLRRVLHEGKDPGQEQRAQRAAHRLTAARALSFRDCAEAYIQAHRPGWKNPKHASQWANTLSVYAFPALGDLPVAAIDTDLVMKCLKPIWEHKTETASRVRNRIELILDWATANNYRQGENPARWRGHLKNLLPPPKKVARVQHFPALSYEAIPRFMAALRAQGGAAARALELLILTASRTHVVLAATWDEIDFEKRLWTVPGARMKTSREHRIPLSKPALAILNAMKEQRQNDYVFPGRGRSGHLSVLDTPLKWMERTDITVHGFRSTFRDWAAETTNYPSEVAEMALAHAVGDKVEAAYRRGDLMEKRRQLMEDWACYCGTGQ